jgi:hypothetical protein
MNDIDFDELDRAVSSVLTPTPTPTPVEAAAVDTPVPAAPEPSITTKDLPVAPRRGGRFMDVVHPSSDMRGAVKTPSRPAANPVVADPPAESDAPKPVSDWPDPIDSPFLAGAQVEKRPLSGEQSTHDSVSDLHNGLPNETPEGEIIPTATEPTSPEAVVPVALDDPETTAAEPAPHVTQTTQSTPVENTGPTSINQQYTELASSAEPSRPIFDTEAYHQPLAHPQKKKSGIFVVLWIFGLIVIGAGLGAVMYFYVLPLL